MYHQTQTATREDVKGVQKAQENLEPMLERLMRLLTHIQQPSAPHSGSATPPAAPTTPQRSTSTPKKAAKDADNSAGDIEQNINSTTPTSGRAAGLLKKDDRTKKKLNLSNSLGFQDQLTKPWVPPGVSSLPKTVSPRFAPVMITAHAPHTCCCVFVFSARL